MTNSNFDEGTLRELRQQAREVARVAKSRGVVLKPPRADATNTQELMEFLSIYGKFPTNRAWEYAAIIAEQRGEKLTPEQAMNDFHCKQYIELNKHQFHRNAPTIAQVELAQNFADLKGIPLPRICRFDILAWENFMEESFTRDNHSAARA